MKKMVLAVIVAVASVTVALVIYFFAQQEDYAGATPCERDCLNDSGGMAFCANYCKQHETYGPQPKG